MSRTERAGETRQLGLEGARNFRDLGGYRTTDGQRVRWRRVFRSGSMAGLTPDDWAQLSGLGVRVVCDLRTPHERERDPFAWRDTPGLTYIERDYPSSFGELRKVMAADLPDGAAARAAMLHGFAGLPYEQAPSYARLFRQLADGAVPAIVNCSAGKDRAGTAAALLLTLLGVPREQVVADFVLTDELGQLRESMLARSDSRGLLARQPDAVSAAILRADPDYITTALDGVIDRHGSFEAYFAEVLGLSAERQSAIRSLLLEPDPVAR